MRASGRYDSRNHARPSGFIVGDSGFSFQHLAGNWVFVPLGIGGGYPHVMKNIVNIDLFARFGWNPFVFVNPPSGTNTVPVAAIIHTSPILHEGDL